MYRDTHFFPWSSIYIWLALYGSSSSSSTAQICYAEILGLALFVLWLRWSLYRPFVIFSVAKKKWQLCFLLLKKIIRFNFNYFLSWYKAGGLLFVHQCYLHALLCGQKKHRFFFVTSCCIFLPSVKYLFSISCCLLPVVSTRLVCIQSSRWVDRWCHLHFCHSVTLTRRPGWELSCVEVTDQSTDRKSVV